MADDELKELQEATEGLEYPSESDAPFEIIRWPAKPRESAMQAVAAHAGRGEPIEEVPTDRFFADLQRSEDAEQFAHLRQTLQRLLSDVHVFRVGAGSVRVTVYLLGKTAQGDWAVLRTISVET